MDGLVDGIYHPSSATRLSRPQLGFHDACEVESGIAAYVWRRVNSGVGPLCIPRYERSEYERDRKI